MLQASVVEPVYVGGAYGSGVAMSLRYDAGDPQERIVVIGGRGDTGSRVGGCKVDACMGRRQVHGPEETLGLVDPVIADLDDDVVWACSGCAAECVSAGFRIGP